MSFCFAPFFCFVFFFLAFTSDVCAGATPPAGPGDGAGSGTGVGVGAAAAAEAGVAGTDDVLALAAIFSCSSRLSSGIK